MRIAVRYVLPLRVGGEAASFVLTRDATLPAIPPVLTTFHFAEMAARQGRTAVRPLVRTLEWHEWDPDPMDPDPERLVVRFGPIEFAESVAGRTAMRAFAAELKRAGWMEVPAA